jgi:hypothetical protein
MQRGTENTRYTQVGNAARRRQESAKFMLNYLDTIDLARHL